MRGGRPVVRRSFATRPLRQRVIALVAAYAIAFAGVIASFVAAQAAVEAATLAHTIICHSSVTEKPALPSGNPDGKISVDCCFGCVTSLGVAVPPTATTVIVPQVLVKELDPLAHFVRVFGTNSNAHRSRGPPLAL